jgi:uncharacterized BrkB/YihY/UPF0761 family membrane protein
VIAGVATGWGALVALRVLRVVHGLVWAVPVRKLNHTWRATGVFVSVATLVLIVSTLMGDLGRSSVLAAIGTDLLFLAIAFGVWLLISWYMPRPTDTSWTALIPGSVLLAFGAQVIHIVTVHWIASLLSRKTATYGAIGIALTLLFWAYLLGRLIIASVVLNASVRMPRTPTGPAAAI